MADQPNDESSILLEVDAPGLSPANVDSVALLRLATAFLRLLLENAMRAKKTLSLEGLAVVDKCAAIRVHADDIVVAKICAAASLRQIRDDDPPHGLQSLADEARAAARLLPGAYRAKVIVGNWSQTIPLPSASSPAPLDSLVAFRARVIRVGGKTPAARFASDFEEDFSLRVSEEQAKELGALLYREIDLDAQVSRNSEGMIEAGRLRSYTPVDEGGAAAAWRDWFKSVGGSEWDQMDEIESELKH